jgi:GNAT superfamily N-acetyltransferase
MIHKNLELNTIELTPKDFARAAHLLAEAFFDNPSHTYIFPNPDTRLKLLQWGLKANLKLNLTPPKNIGHSFAIVEGDRSLGTSEIKAMAFWHLPECGSISLFHKIASGWLIAPWKLGRKNYRRLLEVMSAIDRIKDRVLGDRRAWYLNNMVVAKELRGTGLGTALLKNQLQSVVEPSGFPAILMTQREANVRFYQRLGFEVATESIIGMGESAFTNWCLIRY